MALKTAKNETQKVTITLPRLVLERMNELVPPRQRSRFISDDLDREIADRAGDMIAASRSVGPVLSVPDAIIAATAIDRGLTLVTLNRDGFEPVAGLSLYAIDNDI